MKKKTIIGLMIVLSISGIIVGVHKYTEPQREQLRLKTQQLNDNISYDNERIATNLPDTHGQTDIDNLQSAIDKAKDVVMNPHDQTEVDDALIELSQAETDFTTSTIDTSQYPKDDTGNTDTSDVSTDTTNTTDTSTYISANDEEIWQYTVNRWAYYDTLTTDGYSADKYDTQVFQDGADKFGITPSEVQATWDRVDKIKTGVTK